MRNIDSVKNAFRDFARPNLFTVSVFSPDGSSIGDLIDVGVVEAGIPGYIISEAMFNWKGYRIPIPGDMDFQDIRLTFMNDIDFKLRDYFINWMKLIRNYETNETGNLAAGFLSGRLIIHQLNYAMNPIYNIECFHAYPTSMDEILLSADSENSIENFTITFAYTHFKITKPVN